METKCGLFFSAASACARIFFNPQKISLSTRSVFKSNSCPHAFDGIRIHSRETRPTRCAAILIYFSTSLDSKISGLTVYASSKSLRIYFFHSGERIQKYSDSLPNSPDA